jgi:hypothetical protein
MARRLAAIQAPAAGVPVASEAADQQVDGNFAYAVQRRPLCAHSAIPDGC